MKTLEEFFLSSYPQEIIGWPDDAWEACHNFIQFAFPTRQRSQFHPDAPVIDNKFLDWVELNPWIKEKIVLLFSRFRLFLQMDGENPKLLSMKTHDHNLLRCSRVLECLLLFGLNDEAEWFFLELMKFSRLNPELAVAAQFWKAKMLLGKDKVPLLY